jgi:hypothetical protein
VASTAGADAYQSDALAPKCAEMTALVGWDVHQAGLPDLRQVDSVPACPVECDVALATKHVDELFEDSSLLFPPFSPALQCVDENAGVIRERIWQLKLQLQVRFGHLCPPWVAYFSQQKSEWDDCSVAKAHRMSLDPKTRRDPDI